MSDERDDQTSALTPSQWVSIFAKQGVMVSERRLREAAQKYTCFEEGHLELKLRPEQVDKIFQKLREQRSKQSHG